MLQHNFIFGSQLKSTNVSPYLVSQVMCFSDFSSQGIQGAAAAQSCTSHMELILNLFK